MKFQFRASFSARYLHVVVVRYEIEIHEKIVDFFLAAAIRRRAVAVRRMAAVSGQHGPHHYPRGQVL